MSRRRKKGGRPVSREVSLSAEALATSAASANLHVEIVQELEERLKPIFQELPEARLQRIAEGDETADFPGRAEFVGISKRGVEIIADNQLSKRREKRAWRKEILKDALMVLFGAVVGYVVAQLQG